MNMQITDCKGCGYLIWNLGVGQGIRCSNSQNWTGDRPPQIGEVICCKFYQEEASIADKL
jgi:hypothetical protein